MSCGLNNVCVSCGLKARSLSCDGSMAIIKFKTTHTTFTTLTTLVTPQRGDNRNNFFLFACGSRAHANGLCCHTDLTDFLMTIGDNDRQSFLVRNNVGKVQKSIVPYCPLLSSNTKEIRLSSVIGPTAQQKVVDVVSPLGCD